MPWLIKFVFPYYWHDRLLARNFFIDEYVECTSLITRLARNMGLLDRALINYIPIDRVYLDYYHLFQAHMLKMDQEDDSCVMTYQGCVNEICLSNTEY